MQIVCFRGFNDFSFYLFWLFFKNYFSLFIGWNYLGNALYFQNRRRLRYDLFNGLLNYLIFSWRFFIFASTSRIIALMLILLTIAITVFTFFMIFFIFWAIRIAFQLIFFIKRWSKSLFYLFNSLNFGFLSQFNFLSLLNNIIFHFFDIWCVYF